MTITIPPGENIDGILRANRRPGTRFVLGSGTHVTRGAFAFPEHDLCMLAPGCELIGEGPDQTHIALENPIMSHNGKPTGYVEALTGGARTSGSSNAIVMRDFTLLLDSPGFPQVGIHLWTSRAIMKNVRVEGVWGDRQLPYPNEGFGVLVNNAYEPCHGIDGHHSLDRIEIVMANGAYATGCYVGCQRRTSLGMSYLRRVSVTCPGASWAHAGFGIGDDMLMEECQVSGCERAVFCDTGSMRNVRIYRMAARNIQWAVDLRAPYPDSEIRYVSVEESLIEFGERTPGDWAQVLLVDAPDNGGRNKLVQGVRFERCQMFSRNRNTSLGRVAGVAQLPKFKDCEFSKGTQWQPVVDQRKPTLS